MPNRRHYDSPALAPRDRAFFKAVAAGKMHAYCEFCARRRGRPECPVMADPVAAWSGPEQWCWAYTEDAGQVAAAERAVRVYAAARAAVEGGAA